MTKRLEQALQTIDSFPFDRVKGSLEVREGVRAVKYRRNVFDYERKTIEKTYVSVEEAKLLATKKYYKLLRPILKEEIDRNKRNKPFDAMKKYKVYSNLPKEQKRLVTPLFVGTNDYVYLWEKSPCIQNPYKPENRVFPTARGDLVRSAEEQLIADELFRYRNKILYKYENQLVLPVDREVVYPDFEILSLQTGKVYYLEHFGMLDKDDYFKHSFIEKMIRYENNGIYPRRKITYDFFRERNAC